MSRIVDLLKIVDKMTLDEALIDPDPAITATNLVSVCRRMEDENRSVWSFCSHRVQGRKMLPIGMVPARGRSGRQVEGEQPVAVLFFVNSSRLEFCSSSSSLHVTFTVFVSLLPLAELTSMGTMLVSLSTLVTMMMTKRRSVLCHSDSMFH